MYKYHLSDVEWCEFLIDDLFDVVRGNAKNLTTRELSETKNKSLPLLSSKDQNNALSGFTIKKDSEKSYINAITLNSNGSVGYSFYHSYEFIASTDVSILFLKGHILNENNAIFLIKCIEKIAIAKFAYGYKASLKRLRRTKILLPVDNDRKPNFRFMERYIKERKYHIKSTLIEFLERERERERRTHAERERERERETACHIIFLMLNERIFL
ncbi:restriction endonuclease subunit S [Mesomycoplasma ovipneumoniae]|uniref:restriction endonuclease subunit S n=1 Tax=Mesomycoplasma ovipneumoniae TaxID=29562 RepID=UPI00096A2D50|nr:restriction endonuclease subunit S [Mesomycoplasma ovipneumoniae]